MLRFPAPDVLHRDRSKQVQQKRRNLISCGAAELWPSCWKGNLSRGVSLSCSNCYTSNLQPLFITLLSCLLLNILLLGEMIAIKAMWSSGELTGISSPNYFSVEFNSFPPSTFKHFFGACSPILPLMHQQWEPHRPSSLGSHCQGGTGLSHCSAAGISSAIPNPEYCLPHL